MTRSRQTGPVLEEALQRLCAELPVPLPDDLAERLHAHMQLVRRWNTVTGLVSAGDLEQLETRHLLDSLSLAPTVYRHAGADGVLLDIGTGGGFPAIPIKCALPALQLILVERSTRKVGFLHKAVAALALDRIRLINAAFPALPDLSPPDVVTARAVERPQLLIPSILHWMPEGCAFLCQGAPPTLAAPGLFHVERIEDAWQAARWRRGPLHKVIRLPQPDCST